MPPLKKPLKPAKRVVAAKSVKPAKPAYAGPWFTQQGKPDPNGLFKKDGTDFVQSRFDKDVKRDKFEKQPRTPSDSDAARKAGYAR